MIEGRRKKRIICCAAVCFVLIMAAVLLSSFFSSKKMNRMQIGMIMDTALDDAYTLNDITWRGIKRAQRNYVFTVNRETPAAATEADYLKAIDNLYQAGYRFIVLPGKVFEKVAYQAQELYADTKFVLIDGVPHSGDYNIVMGKNLVSVYFNEAEEGFIAGVAAALEMRDATFTIVAYEDEYVDVYGYGFEQGVAYANSSFSCEAQVNENKLLINKNDQSNLLPQVKAAFDQEQIIFAIGTVNTPVIEEAAAWREKGSTVWVVSESTDKNTKGLVEHGTSCVILAQGIKRVDNAIYDLIEQEINGTFPGGQMRSLDVSTGGIGIPDENPSLSENTLDSLTTVLQRMRNGTIKVKSIRPPDTASAD